MPALCINCAECFEDGKRGGSKRTDLKSTTFKGVSDAFECQKKCQRVSYCQAFVFNTNHMTCNLKTFNSSVDRIVDERGKVFGFRYCPGNSKFTLEMYLSLTI